MAASARRLRLVLRLAGAGLLACHGSRDGLYPSRSNGCAVKTYPTSSPLAEDELGVVRVTCSNSERSCERQLLDAVCGLGGDVAWGLADNALNAANLTAHAAHSKRAAEADRGGGCRVQVFDPAPTVPTDNIGTVTAVCSADDARDVCLRQLEDQVCSLGGDVLWQVEGPAPLGDKVRMRGRAAHTK